MNVMEIMGKDLSQIIDLAKANSKYLPGPVYNVQGKGDGIEDDAGAIQAALNAASAANGSVFFPDGTYLIKSAITVPSGVKRIFAFGNVLLKFYLTIDTTGLLVDGTTDLVYSGIEHTQNPAHNSTTMFLFNTKNTVIENCAWRTTGGMGMGLSKTTDTWIQNCYFNDTGKQSILNPAHPSNPAIWVGEQPSYTNVNVNILKCKFKDTNWSGVYFFAQGGLIEGCDFDGCGESTVFTSYGSAYVRYINNVIKNGHGVNIAGFGLEIGSSQHVTIMGNHIYDCDEAGIGAGDLKDFIIANNTCHRNGKGGGAAESKAGIVLRQTVADPLTTERGIIIGNHCYDESNIGQKVQKYGLSTFRPAGGGSIREVTITGNDFLYNNDAAVFLIDETVIGGLVIFDNNLGYAQQPVVKNVPFPTAPGVLNVTGIGFRPRFVRIDSFINNTRSKSTSYFSTDTDNANIICQIENATTIKTITGACLQLMDDAGTAKTYCTFDSILNDGIKLTVQLYSGPLDTMVTITCYP